MSGSAPLSVLVVDDELPALEELAYLLSQDSRVANVLRAGSGTDALKHLEAGDIDAVFLDIAMPELSGLDVARLLSRFKDPPAVVFVTAHDEYAVTAFEINAVDYLLKPVRAARVAEAVRRIIEGGAPAATASVDDVTIPVELGGVTRFVPRSEVRLRRVAGGLRPAAHRSGQPPGADPASPSCEERWRDAGFVRIHRQCLVSLAHVRQLRQDGSHCSVVVDGTELAVSRRHTRELRDLLVRRARPGSSP